MRTTVHASTGEEAVKAPQEPGAVRAPAVSGKGGIIMHGNAHASRNIAALVFSPRLLRYEMALAVIAALVVGRWIPAFGNLLRQFSVLLF
jgi:hypothetical protein